MKIALAQINVVIGDLAGNADRIIAQARAAHAAGVDLVVTPELSLCGYPPEDLLLRPAFLAACDEQLQRIAGELAGCAGLHVVVGHPQLRDSGVVRERSWSLPPCLNAASVLAGGRVTTPTPSASCPTTRCLTSAATSRRAAMPGWGRWCST